MQIGIDIDGVILDYERMLLTYGELYNSLELKKEYIKEDEHYLNKRFNWNDEEKMNFVNKYFIKLAKIVPFMPGAIDVINMLKKDGHKLIIISARGGLVKEMKDLAIKKFDEANLSFDKYYWNQSDKIEIIKKESIDIMIDDNYDICKKLSENNIKTLYFRDKNMKKLKESDYLKEVSNWANIYTYINKLTN